MSQNFEHLGHLPGHFICNPWEGLYFERDMEKPSAVPEVEPTGPLLASSESPEAGEGPQLVTGRTARRTKRGSL